MMSPLSYLFKSGLIQLSTAMLSRGCIRWIGQHLQVFVLLMVSMIEDFVR